MKRILIIGVVLLFLVSFARSEEHSVKILHYNLFENYYTDIAQFQSEKENKITELLKDETVSVFSFLEDGDNVYFVRKKLFGGQFNFSLRSSTTSNMQHSLFYDKNKIEVIQSQIYSSAGVYFFYYELLFKGTQEPVHLFVYKQSVMEHPVKQHQGILKFIDEKKLDGDFLLLGGSTYPIRLLKESYITPPKSKVEFVNLKSFYYLYDNEYRFIWHADVDFLYASKGVWLPNDGHVTYKSDKSLLDKDDISHFGTEGVSKNRAFTFTLQVNKEENKPIYKEPAVEIISQNKDLLSVAVVWDQDVALNLEIVSIIGNSFYSLNIEYAGIKKIYNVDIKSLPTGIYILKVTDKDGRKVFRKFTKY